MLPPLRDSYWLTDVACPRPLPVAPPANTTSHPRDRHCLPVHCHCDRGYRITRACIAHHPCRSLPRCVGCTAGRHVLVMLRSAIQSSVSIHAFLPASVSPPFPCSILHPSIPFHSSLSTLRHSRHRHKPHSRPVIVACRCIVTTMAPPSLSGPALLHHHRMGRPYSAWLPATPPRRPMLDPWLFA